MIAAERKTALLNAMQKLEAYRQIQNEMGRAVAAFNFRQADRLLSFFALDKADVSLEYADEGVFNGPEAVKAIVNDVVGKEPKPGEMLDMQLTTPIIEIARPRNAYGGCPAQAPFPRRKATRWPSGPGASWQ